MACWLHPEIPPLHLTESLSCILDLPTTSGQLLPSLPHPRRGCVMTIPFLILYYSYVLARLLRPVI